MKSSMWLKLYVEILDDPKMGMLSDRAYRRAIELFLLAKDCDHDGELPPMAQIAWRLHTTIAELAADIQPLLECGILTDTPPDGLVVTNFSKRQSADPDAVRKQRERYGRANVTKRDNNVTDDVTKRDNDRHVIPLEGEGEGEGESEKESEGEGESTSSVFLSLLSEFTEHTGIKHSPEFDQEIHNLIALGARPGDIRRTLAEINGRYTIKSPRSIHKAIQSVIAKRSNGNGGAGWKRPGAQEYRGGQ